MSAQTPEFSGATAVGRHTDGSDVVILSDLEKCYRIGADKVPAVNVSTLRVAAGSVVAVTGQSGSGKSTLLRLIGGIESADRGAVTVDGTDVTSLNGRELAVYRRRVGFVFQAFQLLPALTALENVTLPVLPRRTSFNKSARARQLLAQVGLTGREGAQPTQLSGGQQQRVAIARALITSPRLLLADEPTGSLDTATSAAILDLLLHLRKQEGLTVLIATHDPDVARRCDRVVELRDGIVVSDSMNGSSTG